MVKQSICKKTAVPGMEKPFYLPSCLQQCAEMCGVRCRRKCWGQHPGSCSQDCKTPCSVVHPPICSRGKLGENFLFCPSIASRSDDFEPSLGYIKFKKEEVPTYGKGAAFSRMEKKETQMPESAFTVKFKMEFETYAEHIVPSWFLRYLYNSSHSSFYMLCSQERKVGHVEALW